MSIYIGNNLEDRLNVLEVENALLKKYNEYNQVVYEIDHTSDLHVDSSFYKRSMKLDKYVKINEWFDSSLGQSMVIQRLDAKRPALSNPDQTQNKRDTLISKMDLILFVALTSIIQRQPFSLFLNNWHSFRRPRNCQ